MHLKRGLPSVNFVKSMKGERMLFYDFDLLQIYILTLEIQILVVPSVGCTMLLLYWYIIPTDNVLGNP